MKPGKQNMPRIIVLGVLVAVALGYVTYTVTAGGGPSRKSSKPAKQAVAQETKAAEDASMPQEYAGKYIGRYIINDDQSREWAGRAEISIDAAGAINGHVWIPTTDGGPGLVSIVTGEVDPSGGLQLRSDKAAAGLPDGTLQGTPIERFQFRHVGRVEDNEGRLSITAEGKGNQGFDERLVANRAQETQQLAQALIEPASHVVAEVQTIAGRDPFAPWLVPDQFREQNKPAPRPAQPAPQLAKLPTFGPPDNVALGIKPLPPVPSMDDQVAPKRDPEPDFVVTGVIVGPVNVAILRDGTDRHIVKEGQTINGKYFVKTITRDQVVLRNKQNHIYLKLGGSANAS